MPSPTSDNPSTNQNSRYDRAKAAMTASLPQSTDGSGNGHIAEPKKQPDEWSRSRAPKRDDGQIDKVLAALAGDKPQPAKKGLEAGLIEDAGRGGIDSPPNQQPSRPAFDDDEDGDELETSAKPRKIKAKSLTEFAEAVEVEPKAIYGLEVPIDDGEEPVTIGALKDHFKATRDLEDRRVEFEDYRGQAQNEIIRGRNELDVVLERIAEVVPAKQMATILDSVRGQAVETKQRAARELREYFPEWDDDDKRKAAGAKMRGWLQSYGIPGEALDTIYDAKIIRMLWQMGSKAERYMALRQGQREKKPSVEPKSSRKKPSATPSETARDRVAKGDRVGAVAALLLGEK